MWTGPGRDLPLTAQLSSEPDPAWVVLLHPQQSPRHVVGPSQSDVGINEGPGDGRPRSPTWPLTQRRNHPGANVLGRGPLPRRLAGIEGLLSRCGAPGGHWQGRGRAWGARGPLGAGGCSRVQAKQKTGPVSFPASHTLSPCGCDSHSQGHSGHLVRGPLLPMASPRPGQSLGPPPPTPPDAPWAGEHSQCQVESKRDTQGQPSRAG